MTNSKFTVELAANGFVVKGIIYPDTKATIWVFSNLSEALKHIELNIYPKVYIPAGI